MPWRKTEPMEQRIEFALKAMQTLNFRALCQEYGISTKTGYKWKERFMREGLEGMREESRRPKSHAAQLSEEEVCEIVRLKLAHMSWGPRKVRALYSRRHGQVASESTFKRVLERAGLTQKRRRRCCAEAGRLSSGRRASAPNEIWTVDFKGWWRSYGKRKNQQTCQKHQCKNQKSVTDVLTQMCYPCFDCAYIQTLLRSLHFALRP
jgi:transposase